MGVATLTALGSGWTVAHSDASETPLAMVSPVTPPTFGFGTWEPASKRGGGPIELTGLDGKGGYGYVMTIDLSAYAEASPALRVDVQPGNAARTLRMMLRDADGTEFNYQFPVDEHTQGEVTLTPQWGASLTDPNEKGKPGNVEGLDLSAIAQVQVQGDWSDRAFALSVLGVQVQPVNETLLTGRAARVAENEKKRLEAEQAVRDALSALRRTPTSPVVERVYAVSPSILALQVQAGSIPPVTQEPYVEQPGDIIEPSDKSESVVWSQGTLKMEPTSLQLKRVGDDGNAKVIGFISGDRKHLWRHSRVVGEPLTDVLIRRAQAYTLASNDDPNYAQPTPPIEVHQKSKPNGQSQPDRDAMIQHRIYLQLPHPLQEGAAYTLSLPGINTSEPSVAYTHAPRTTQTEAIHATHVGYRPTDPFKAAYLSLWLGTGGGLAYDDAQRFELINDATGLTEHEGTIELAKGLGAPETLKLEKDYAMTAVYRMDFSGFQGSGVYRVYVPGVGVSGPVPIGESVWRDAFHTSMRGFLHHRSGIALGPPLTDYVRPRSFHPGDGVTVFALDVDKAGESESVNKALRRLTQDGQAPRDSWPAKNDGAWGGYMDAGDWDRRSPHMHPSDLHLELLELFPDTLASMKLAVPAEEASNALPDLLDEVLWNVGLYLRLQDADGGIGGGVESTGHPRWGEASWQETLAVGAFKADIDSTYQFAATAARLARVAEPYDSQLAATYLAAATRAWDWAQTHHERFLADAQDKDAAAKQFSTVRQRAAVELYRTTSEQAYHEAFLTASPLAQGTGDPDESACFAYARLPQGMGDEALKATATKVITDAADRALAFAAGNSFGIVNAIPDLPVIGFVAYFSAPGVLSQSVPRAHALTGDERYLAGTVQSANFSAGANPDNMSYTTGIGWNPPRRALHIDSWITGQPAPAGITVYGPTDPAENWGFNDWMHIWFLGKQMTPDSRSWPVQESYVDAGLWPSMNEYTVHQTLAPTSYTWGYLAGRGE